MRLKLHGTNYMDSNYFMVQLYNHFSITLDYSVEELWPSPMLLQAVLVLPSNCVISDWNFGMPLAAKKVFLMFCNIPKISIIVGRPSRDSFVQRKPTVTRWLIQLSSLSSSMIVLFLLNKLLSTTSPTWFGKWIPTHFCKFISSTNMLWMGFFLVSISHITTP